MIHAQNIGHVLSVNVLSVVFLITNHKYFNALLNTTVSTLINLGVMNGIIVCSETAAYSMTLVLSILLTVTLMIDTYYESGT